MRPVAGIAELAADLAAGRTHSATLVQRAFARIRETNDDWHIFISLREAEALAEASASDRRRRDGQSLGPLDGIPIAIKDNIDVEGMPTTDGTGFYRQPQSRDAFVIERLKAAGAIILGKLNMHECALGATTDNPFWGRCANPAVPGATPGGSSGGSGAVIAGDIVPLSLGTDTMGSVRIPAAYCGCWGIKPTRGLVSSRGLATLSWTLDTIGVLATNADDLAIGLAAIQGHDPNDPDSLRPPLNSGPAMSDRPFASLVLGRPAELATVACEPAVLSAYERMLSIAEQAGATIKPVSISGWDPTLARRAGLLISEAEVANRVGADVDQPGDGFSKEFRALVNYGRNAPGAKVAAAYRRLELQRLATLAVLDTVDALILPTAPQLAFPHGAPVPVNQADLTALANIAFCPAVAFPVPSGSGAPASCQLVGKPLSEMQLIAAARYLAAIAAGQGA